MSIAAERTITQDETEEPPLSPGGTTPFGSSYLGFFRLALYGLLTLALTPVQVVILLVLPRMWSAVPFAYHKLCCRIMGLKVRVVGTPAKARPVLFVSNHVSYLDIPVLGSVVPVAFVAKTEVSQWPGYGWLAKLQRTVFVDRRRNTTKQQRALLHAHLAGGDALVLFPEGTSNDGNRILPFRSALLSVAEAAAHERPLAVQPVSIAYTSVNGVPLGWGLRPLVAWYGGMELAGHLWHFTRLGQVEGLVVGLEVTEVEAPGAAHQRRDRHVGERLQARVARVPLAGLAADREIPLEHLAVVPIYP